MLVLVSVVGCGQANGTRSKAANTDSMTTENTPRVQIVTVKPQDLARKIELPGTVEGYETADLYAKVGGFLAEINADIGDQVTKGQVLARLSIPEMQRELQEKQSAILAAEAGVEHSRAALHEAKTELLEKEAKLKMRVAEFDRVQNLVQRGSLQQKIQDESMYERDAAQAGIETTRAHIQTAEAVLKSSLAQVQLARAEHAKVETMLDYGEIRAPFDGMVSKRFVDPGSFIQPADGNSAARPLLTVTRIDVVRIRLDLPMAEVGWLDRGDRVTLDRINVLPEAKFEGTVTRFASVLDRTSRMMHVEIDLPNPERQLLPGYYGYVTLFLDEMAKTAVVPSSALVTDGTDTFVYVVQNGICQRRPVLVIFQDGSVVGVGSGLTPGEQVIRSGGGQLKEGQQVIAVSAGA